jgi:hypothetical protein
MAPVVASGGTSAPPIPELRLIGIASDDDELDPNRTAILRDTDHLHLLKVGEGADDAWILVQITAASADIRFLTNGETRRLRLR